MVVKEIIKQKESDCLVTFLDSMFDNWLEKSSFGKENMCCPGRTYDQIKKKIEELDGNPFEFIVCMDGESVVGMTYASYFDEECMYLGLINVHPEYRKRGVFKAILDKAEEICNVKEVKYMRLCTWHGNDVAIHTFQKYGFEVYGEDEKSIELRKYIKIND